MKTRETKIIHGDCLDEMKKMKSGSVDLLITSPPYYNARDYSTWETFGDYLDTMAADFREIYRLIKPQKIAVVNIGDIIGRTNSSPTSRRRIPLAAHFILMMEEIGFTFMEDFIWFKGMVYSKRAFAGRPYPHQKYPINSYEHLLVFAKVDRRPFTSCPKCGNPKIYKKGVSGGLEVWECRNQNCAAKGHKGFTFSRKSELQRQYEKTENEIPAEILKFWREDVVEFHPTAANRKSKIAANGQKLVGHTAPFPEKIPEFALRFYSGVGDLVLDPFLGSGTSGVVAKKLKRNFIGIEIHQEYVKLAKNRIEEVKTDD